MAAYACDDVILNILNKALESTILSVEDKQTLQSCVDSGHLSVCGVKVLLSLEKSSGCDVTSIASAIRGKPIVFPAFENKPMQDSKEKQLRRQYLQNKIHQREYNRMVYGTELSPAEREVQSVSNQLSSVRNQISIGVNMIVAIVATFGICYYVGGQFTTNTSTRMIYGLTGAILVMILEMVLYILRAARMESMEQSMSKKANEPPRHKIE